MAELRQLADVVLFDSLPNNDKLRTVTVSYSTTQYYKADDIDT